MNLSNYKSLGVINRTPNSFSDRGASLNLDYFQSQLQSFLDDPTVIIDVGFESTAPMNKAITDADEYARFRDFLEATKNVHFGRRFISFDTYKVQNFTSMVAEFSKIHPYVSFIFNDVSGVLNEELALALSKFKNENFYYIYTFSHIPSRDQVLNHMSFLNEDEDIIKQVSEGFLQAKNFFKDLGMEDKLLLDPGFGFSKTFDQNWRLINHFGELDQGLNNLGLSSLMVIGLSKKSFLKKALGTDESGALEALHLECLIKMRNQTKRELLFRVHDPKLLLNSL